ncbi:hypothetical protein DITRI_Ditri12bG0033300 [Diplodiscus trichospermus]
MCLSAAFNFLKSSNLISWKTTVKLQQTLAGCIELTGKTLRLLGEGFDDEYKIRTVEHLLSALESKGAVDNCRIQIQSFDPEDPEVPIFDGSASAWVDAIEQVGRKEALDRCGSNVEKLAPYLNEPLHVSRNDSFMFAFPSPEAHITCGIDFPKVPAIRCQWFSSALDDSYERQIACSRTFCIYEEVEHMRSARLIKGGSLANAIVCSASQRMVEPTTSFP